MTMEHWLKQMRKSAQVDHEDVTLALPDWPGLAIGNVIPTPAGYRKIVDIRQYPTATDLMVVLEDGAGEQVEWAANVLLRHADLYTHAQTKRLWVDDPAPDVGEFSDRWTELLSLAYDLDAEKPDGVFAALRGIRCWRADLEWTGSGWRIVRGEIDEDEWEDIKAHWLRPHLETIRLLLRKI